MINKTKTIVSVIFAMVGAFTVPGYGAEMVDDAGIPLVNHGRAFAK